MTAVFVTFSPQSIADEGRVTDLPAAEAAELVRLGGARYATDADIDTVKGQALDDALAAAGLPRTGTADEKRQRLADHDQQ